MRKLVIAFISIYICSTVFAPPSLAAENKTAIADTAQAAIVMEVYTGRELFSKNAVAELPMASTTKIMTAILAIENGNLNDVITVPPEGSGVEGSSLYLNVGEHITLENLLYGLMMWSGNDAAVTIAIHIGGTLEGFIDMMNEKAREIGANNTHFVNPNGLPAKDHYTTASDLGKIAVYAMRNDTFRKIVSTQEREIPWEGNQYSRHLRNKNKLLFNYNGANGVKTGYTKAAGRCLVSSALRDGIQLVSVVLNCGDMYGDSAKLLDYGFTQITQTKVLNKGENLGFIDVSEGIETDRLELLVKDDIVIPLKKNEAESVSKRILKYEGLSAPIEAGQIIGKIELYLGEDLMAESDIVAQQDVRRITYGYYVDRVFRDWLAQPQGEGAASY